MFSSEKDHVNRSLLSGVSRCCVYEEKKRDFYVRVGQSALPAFADFTKTKKPRGTSFDAAR
jgi:hypothetical protein